MRTFFVILTSLYSVLALGQTPNGSSLSLSGAPLVTPDSGVCARSILFLPQLHEDQLTGLNSAALTKMISQSQFAIATELFKHSNAPVFSEGTYAIMDLDWYRKNADDSESTIQKYKNAFPVGLPKSYSEMTVDQTYKIAKAGGDLTLLLLGLIPRIYPVATDATAEDNFFKISQAWLQAHPGHDFSEDPQMDYIAMTRRERLALQQVDDFFAKNQNQNEVILIFGSNHVFTKYPDLFDPKCIRTGHTDVSEH